MKIAIAADHAGYDLKEFIIKNSSFIDVSFVDLGTDSSTRPDDYPDFAYSIGTAILKGQAERGILICGSGVGASVAANKIPGIRAGLCHDHYSARQGVEHDDMNVLVMGSRVIGIETARDLVQSFLSGKFTGEERHVRRLNKVKSIESHPPTA